MKRHQPSQTEKRPASPTNGLRLYVPDDSQFPDEESAHSAHARNAAAAIELIQHDLEVAQAVAGWAKLSKRRRRGVVSFSRWSQTRPWLEKATLVFSSDPHLSDCEVASIVGVRRETLGRSSAYRLVKRRRWSTERAPRERKYLDPNRPSLRVWRSEDVDGNGEGDADDD